MTIFDGPILEIDLSRIVANYRTLQSHFSGAECAAVVKANAYGLGAEAVSTALADAGCQSFFVATLEEGIALRSMLPDRRIAVFHGVGHGEAMAFLHHHLIPVLNSPQQIERWREVARANPNASSILHVDSAMARLGLTSSEWTALAAQPDVIRECQISLLMSHLACASEPKHPQNAQQLERFESARAAFPTLPCSLANSAGIFLGAPYHYQLARPGCSLYGITPDSSRPNPVQNVVRLSAPILQIRTLDSAQSIGYGATVERPAGSRIATVAIGYADGIFRCLSNQLSGYVGDIQVPLVGRVTMDMLSFDVSAVPEGQMSDRIVLIDDRQDVDAIASLANTIGYEVFTRLGRRVRREYVEMAA